MLKNTLVLAFEIIVQPFVVSLYLIFSTIFPSFLKQHYVFSTPDYKSEPILGTLTNNYTETLIFSFQFHEFFYEIHHTLFFVEQHIFG